MKNILKVLSDLATYFNLVGQEYAAGKVPRYAAGNIDNSHPDGSGQLFHVAHHQHLEDDCDQQVEQAEIKNKTYISHFGL